MKPPQIILLNGASSSGKTGIARVLQRELPTLYLHVSFDHFIAMLPERFSLQGEAAWNRVSTEWSEVLPKLLPGFNGSLAALAAADNYLIVDHVLLGEANRMACVKALRDYSTLFVGVHCTIEELERRERQRGDRPSGLVRYQFEHVHQPGEYDIEVDTTAMSTGECSQQILKAISELC